MRNPVQLLSSFFFFALTNHGAALAQRTAPAPVHVGAILDLEENSLVGKMANVSLAIALEDFYATHGNFKTKVVLHIRNSREDVVEAASAAVDLIKNEGVRAIIGPLTSVQAAFVIDVGNKTQVPVVSFSATSPSLSPSRSPYFVRTTLNSSSVVNPIAVVAKAFGWREVVPVYEDTDYGIGFLPYLVDAFISIDARVTNRSAIPPSASDEHIVRELVNLNNSRTRVFVVHMLPTLGSRLFLKAKELGMMAEGYVWITTDVMMDMASAMNRTVAEALDGAIGFKPYVPESEDLRNFSARWKTRFHREYPDSADFAEFSTYALWAYDTAWAMALAVEKAGLNESGQWQTTSSGDQTRTDLTGLRVSQTGPRLLAALLNTTLNKLSGEFRLVDGQLQSSIFQIINVVGGVSREVGFWTSARGVQPWLNSTNKGSTKMDTALREVVWPGGSSQTPKGWQLPTSGKKLRFAVPAKAGFKEFVDVEGGNFSGYSIAMFDAAMKFLNYGGDYVYIPAEAQGESATYDQLIDLIYSGKFQRLWPWNQEVDGVVGDLTIVANRSKYADFTLPYTESGVAMVVPVKENKNKNPWVFLAPLTTDLWLGSLSFFVFTGFVVWAIEHKINDEFRGSTSQQIGTTLYFAFSTMVYAHREKVESNLSRFLLIIWLFVVLILTSSYTASLTSMLTVQQLQPTVTDLSELLKDGSVVGYQDGSFVKGMLTRLKFDESKLKPLGNVSDYFEALSRGSQNGGVSAIIDEIPYLQIFLEAHCSKFAMIGPIYKTDGFGFALARGSPLVPHISRAILNITEGGMLRDNTLAKKPTCEDEADVFNSSRLSFRSFSGLFLVTGVVSIGCLLIFCVFLFYKNWSELGPAISRGSIWDRIAALGKYFDQRDNSSHGFRGEKGTKKGCDCEDRRPVGETQTLGDGSQTPLSISVHSFMAHALGEDGRPSTSSEIESMDLPPEERRHSSTHEALHIESRH